MEKASAVNGRAVVTLSNAAKMGHSVDVLFDATYRQVLGFRVKRGAFSHTEAVSRATVSPVGADAVTVPSPEMINAEERFADLAGVATLTQAQGTKVVTEGGRLLGTIADLEVDDEVRTVTRYILASTLLDRLRGKEPAVSAQQVPLLGDGGIMIVTDAVAQSLEAQ